MIEKKQIVGVILAGGKASRMNFQDKALLPLGAKPLIEHVIGNACSQVGRLVISVNRNPEKFHYLGLPLLPDHDQAFAGPLLGICSAMRWMIAEGADVNRNYLACFPADVPWFPDTLIHDLAHAINGSDFKVAWSEYNGQVEPLFSLWSLESLPRIEQAIDRGLFGPKLLMPELANVLVSFQPSDYGYFLNINSEDALRTAQEMLEAQ